MEYPDEVQHILVRKNMLTAISYSSINFKFKNMHNQINDTNEQAGKITMMGKTITINLTTAIQDV